MKTRDWEAAQRQVRDWEVDGKQSVEPQIVTVKQACDAFLQDAKVRGLSLGTLANYKRLLSRLEAFAESEGVHVVAGLTVPHLVKFRAQWKQNNLTALKQLERLRSFFRFARDNGWVTENLGSKLKSPRVPPARTLPFSQEDMTAIIEAASVAVETGRDEARANNLRLRTLILFLRFTGLRIGDAVGCSVERVADGRLRLYTQKTGTHVHLPLPEFLLKALESTPRRSERYWFWSGTCKLQTAVTDWQTRLRALFKQAGVAKGHAHRFRDSFSVSLLVAGVPLERVSVALGHSSVKVTEKHYSPWVRERQEQLESDVRRIWQRDPFVLMENAALATDETRGTQQVRGKNEAVN